MLPFLRRIMVPTGLAFALARAIAASEPSSVALEWNAPTGCADASAAQADLERLTGGAVLVGESANLLRATITTSAHGYALVLDLRIDGVVETRTLESVDCGTLARAATLMMAVALAPVATTRVLDEPQPPEIAPLPEIVAAPVVDTPPRAIEPAPPARARAKDRAVLGVWTGPSLGTNPRPTAIVGADVGWRRGAIGVQLSGWHAFALERSIETGIGVRASTTGGGARLVYAIPAGPLELPIGVGVELGALRGGGTGTRVQAKTTQSLWAAAAVGIGLAWPARGRFALGLRADTLIALRSPGIHLDTAGDPRTVFVAPRVGLRVLVGPIFRLP